METFHRLAGMTETSNAHSDQPSIPIQVPEPPPIPTDDETSYGDASASNRASRASLPLNRRASHKSFRSGKSGRRGKDSSAPDTPRGATGEDRSAGQQNGYAAGGRRGSQDSIVSSGSAGSDGSFTWGPTHPCFPHPNPHCDPDSQEFQSTRVIRIRRDWLQSGDLYPQYANLYPEILEPLVTEAEFRFLITSINTRLKAIFNPYTTRAVLDAFMGMATGYVWDDCGLTGVKRGMKDLERFIDKWNSERKREGKDVRVVQVRNTGGMSVDFVIPDPGVVDVGQRGSGEEEDNDGVEAIGPAK